MSVSRIDLADAGSPDKLVSLILKHEPNIALPIPIRTLCKQLDIMDICARDLGGFEGGLVTDTDRSNGIITHREDRSEERKRFTIGHELGHFLMPHHVPDKQGHFLCSAKDFATLSKPESDKRAQMEFEANRFASLMLVPPPILRKHPDFNREPDLDRLRKLAKVFCVSKDVMARAYADYHENDIAIVIVKDGIVQRFYRNASKFPFVTAKLKAPVPVGSMFRKLQQNVGSVSGLQTCIPENWIDTDSFQKTPELFEQVMWQREGFAMILLTLVRPDEDEEDEDRQIERNWHVGFRKR
jgi:IrrE N-terminal-like domain